MNWAGHAGDIPQGDTRDNGQGRTRVDSEQARIGQRVARHRLHDDTGHAKGTAHQHRHQGAGKAELSHQQVIADAGIKREEGVQDYSHREPPGAHAKAHQHQQEQPPSGSQQTVSRPRGTAPAQGAARHRPNLASMPSMISRLLK